MRAVQSPVNRLMHSPRKPFQLILLFGLLLLAAIQLTFLVYIIKETYIAGPVQDSWGIIPYIKQTLAHGNWFNSELWFPQNSHRLVLLRLEFLIDYSYFHGSNIFLIGLSCLLIAVEGVLFAWALNIQKKSDSSQWVILLSTILLISFPSIAWSFLHIFNIHMLQLAVFAVLSCTLISKALSEKKDALFVSGIIAAIFCNFSTFSISAIWPALILLLILNKTDKYRAGILVVTAIVVSLAYIQWLPTGENNIHNYTIFSSLLSPSPPEKNVFLSLEIFIWLFKYLITYLSIMPIISFYFQIITVFTLIWFVFGCYNAIKNSSSQEEKTALSLMCFGICLGVTTGIGRGYLGDLATGDRFQPMVLVYWTGFIIHLLHYLKNRQNIYLFNFSAAVFFCFITIASFINSVDMGKKLTEDYTRFAKMQMAYLSDNFGENAIYENMVAEWRKHSYSGILAIIPYLKENQLGIFYSPAARYIDQHKNFSFKKHEPCMNVRLIEKTRNNDPLIRNIIIESTHRSDAKHYPYLLLYTDGVLNGIAFKKRYSLQHIFQDKSTWLGITRTPPTKTTTTAIAFESEIKNCQVKIIQ